MSEGAVPKCTSWRGHKFEARYSTETAQPNQPLTFAQIGVERMSEYTFSELFEVNARQSEKRTYVHDICTRCGFQVKRHD